MCAPHSRVAEGALPDCPRRRVEPARADLHTVACARAAVADLPAGACAHTRWAENGRCTLRMRGPRTPTPLEEKAATSDERVVPHGAGFVGTRSRGAIVLNLNLNLNYVCNWSVEN